MPNPRKPRAICRNCGMEVARRPNVYCGGRCQHDFEYREIITAWLKGEISGTSTEGRPAAYVRRYLIGIYGEKCSLCGWCERNPVTGRVPIEIDHINGDWRNNTPENLRFLCPNCHSLTPTFRNLNKGKGRENRNKKRLPL